MHWTLINIKRISIIFEIVYYRKTLVLSVCSLKYFENGKRTEKVLFIFIKFRMSPWYICFISFNVKTEKYSIKAWKRNTFTLLILVPWYNKNLKCIQNNPSMLIIWFVDQSSITHYRRSSNMFKIFPLIFFCNKLQR